MSFLKCYQFILKNRLKKEFKQSFEYETCFFHLQTLIEILNISVIFPLHVNLTNKEDIQIR